MGADGLESILEALGGRLGWSTPTWLLKQQWLERLRATSALSMAEDTEESVTG